MSKNILIKLVIFLVVVSLVYSVFWFFKAGQLHKQVEAFVSKNSNYVSVGSIEVTGFPLVQKVTITDLKFTLPSSLLSKRQTIVKKLEAKSSVLSSNFTVALLEPVSLQDSDNNLASVEFSKDPEITISIMDGAIQKFTYQDFGYRILAADKTVIYAASSSSINIESTTAENSEAKSKVSINIKDIEGFDVVDIYKNIFEKKITEGLKTGEIILGSSVSSDANIVKAESAAPASTEAQNSSAANPAAGSKDPTSANLAAVQQKGEQAAPATNEQAAPAQVATSTDLPADAQKDSQKMAEAAADNNLVKSNFMAEFEYALIANKDEQAAAQVPSDPTQIQEVPTQNNKVIKILSMEFSNNLYKILINGEANILADDPMPSGSLAIKVEKVDNLVNHLGLYFSKTIDQNSVAPQAAPEVNSADLAAANAANPNSVADDLYRAFLKKFSTNFGAVVKELAAKNPVSKDDLAEFDIRREKNLEFLVNETSVREIFGKF